jgi:hypothetical protein
MPDVSLRQADGLVTEVMRERGYPMDDFDDQVELSSVEHPEIVEHHWRAHSVVVASQRRQASTDDARRAFVSYRMLVTTCWPAATRTGRESNRAPVGEQEGILTNEALHRDRI